MEMTPAMNNPPPADTADIPPAEREALARSGILVTSIEALYNLGRANSVWPLQFGLACCAIEMVAAAASRFDIARFGAEIFRPSPRQADLLIVSGTVTKKMAPQVVRIWNQMPEPKYCIAMGACAISGGPFRNGYNVLRGIDRFIPVDLCIPGCPPRPEALLNGLIQLQKKMRREKLAGPAAAPFADKSDPRVFPVPEYGPHGLVPPRNPALNHNAA
jgi:NADH-quinone oxidoreductase subunit B